MKPTESCCGATSHGWYCTREAKHEGKHEAWGTKDRDKPFATWTDETDFEDQYYSAQDFGSSQSNQTGGS